MAISENQKRARDKWNAENLEKVQFYAPKGLNEKIKARADELEMSKASYIRYAIDEEIKSNSKSIVIKTTRSRENE